MLSNKVKDGNFCIDGDFFLRGNYSIAYSNINSVGLLDEQNFKTVLVNQLTKKIKFLDYVLILLNDINNIFLSNENNNWSIIKLAKEKIEFINNKFDFNLIDEVLDNNTFLTKKESLITCHNLDTGEELWNTDWKALINDTTAYLLTNKLLVVNTFLFLSFANKDQNPIGSIVINTITGELVQKLPLLKGFLYNNNDTSIVATSGIFNNTQTLSIYNINANTCKQIVLNTIFHKPNWSIKHESSVIHNNKLYLAIQQGATFIASVLAILDLETYQILDTHEFLKDDKKESNPDNWLHIEKIKVNDFMIAVLTAGGTLHVFEKEESI